MLCLPGFGTHANTQNLPHFRAFPASIQEHSPPKCLFFMANAKLPNRPGFALLLVLPQWKFQDRIEISNRDLIAPTVIEFFNHSRSAPKGRQQMGETGFCKNLRFSAVSCANLRFPAVFCANLRLSNPLIYRSSRKSAKICENVRSGSGFSLLLSPFWRALTQGPLGVRTEGWNAFRESIGEAWQQD